MTLIFRASPVRETCTGFINWFIGFLGGIFINIIFSLILLGTGGCDSYYGSKIFHDKLLFPEESIQCTVSCSSLHHQMRTSAKDHSIYFHGPHSSSNRVMALKCGFLMDLLFKG